MSTAAVMQTHPPHAPPLPKWGGQSGAACRVTHMECVCDTRRCSAALSLLPAVPALSSGRCARSTGGLCLILSHRRCCTRVARRISPSQLRTGTARQQPRPDVGCGVAVTSMLYGSTIPSPALASVVRTPPPVFRTRHPRRYCRFCTNTGKRTGNLPCHDGASEPLPAFSPLGAGPVPAAPPHPFTPHTPTTYRRPPPPSYKSMT